MAYFPKNKRAADCTLAEQWEKVEEEFKEVKESLICESDERIAEEAFDLIHAVEGLIDKLNVDKGDIIEKVYFKNHERGDYEHPWHLR